MLLHLPPARGHKALHAILLNLVAPLQRMAMRPGHAVALAIPPVAIHPLDGPEALPGMHHRVARRAGRNRRRHVAVQRGLGPGIGKVLGDFDLDVAQVALARAALALLLAGVVRLGRPRRAALHAAVPVVRDEGLALVALRRAVRVDVVDVREVRLELLVREDDDVVDVEESLAPCLEIRRVDDHFALADFVRHGVC